MLHIVMINLFINSTMLRRFFLTLALVTFCLNTFTIAAPRPMREGTKQNEIIQKPCDAFESTKPLIFSNEKNLSTADCGLLKNNTQDLHFSWDVLLNYNDRVCAGVFISKKAILTSASCLKLNIEETFLIEMENGQKITANTSMVKLFGKLSSAFSFAVINLPRKIENIYPICLWNFGPKTSSYGSHQQYRVYSLKENRRKAPANIESPAMCYAYANANTTNNLKKGKILCTSVPKSYKKINRSGFLIKRTQQRWFLRGISLRKTEIRSKKVNAFNDIFPHLRWIAENSEGIHALPDVPKPAKPYDFKSGEENLSFPECGLLESNKKVEKRSLESNYQVYKGRTAEKGAHPWFALVEVFHPDTNKTSSCGGTIISENVIVTAAHCVTFDNNVTDVPVNWISAVLGVHNISDWELNQQEIYPIKIIVHENYTNFKNDIALLIFKEKFNLTSGDVSPLCLWNQGGALKTIVDKVGTVVGLGSTGMEDDNETVVLPNLLQRADITVVSYEQCYQTGKADTFELHLSPGENFCAGYKNGTTTCQGDSGGGLAFEVDGRWYLRGIVSFGPALNKKCDNNYVVFADVANYVEWIMDSIKNFKITST